MKQLLILLVLVAVGSSSVWNGGLRIRFDIGVDFGGSFFYDIPRTVENAVSEGWTTQEQPSGLPVTSLTMYCYSDLVVCTFYDEDGDVAGMQVALQKDNFTPYYDMETTGFTEWTVGDVSYWTLQQFFTTEEILSTRRLRNENKITENGGVWLVGVNKDVVHISNLTSTIESEAVFTEQACIPWMGRHYYYKMTTSLSCTDEPLYPWFGIVESGELVATGFMVFGSLTVDSDARNWFETPDRSTVELQKDKFTPYYDMETTGFTEWTVDDISYWTLQQYFTTEEILSARSFRNENKIKVNGGVWLVGVNKEVSFISNSTSTIQSEAVFTEQSCIPWMGRHYYYNMTTSLSCTDEPLYPWFGIVESGELVATGFMVFGSLAVDSDARTWFETPDRAIVEFIVPNGPECMYDIVENYGRLTMHIYYIDQPWLISCIFQ